MLRPLQSVSQRLRALQALQHGAWEVTRSLGSSGAGEQAGGEATAAAAAAAGAPARGADTSTPERVARVIATAFHKCARPERECIVVAADWTGTGQHAAARLLAVAAHHAPLA